MLRPRSAGIVVAGAAVMLASASVGVSAAPSSTATLAGSVPSWATSSNFKQAASGSDNVGFRVYLGWQNESQAEALAAAVSTPGNRLYGHYLTPAQFHQQFSPSQATVNAVRSWLQSQGFSVDYVPANNHFVEAEGSVAQAASAFHTSFGMYSVRGQLVRSNESALSVPSSIASAVSGVVGLDDSWAFVHTDMAATDPDASPAPAFVNAPPCSTYWGEKVATQFPNPYGSGSLPYVTCGYSPAQIKGAYGLSGTTLDGSGQTVAIIDAFASPTILSDVNTWSSARGLPSMNNSTLKQVVVPGTYHHGGADKRHDPQGWYGEETLDVEAVHGMAPGANIVFVGSPNNEQDMDNALNFVVDTHAAQMVSNSYGFATELLPFGFIKGTEETLIQAAAEGIGVYFSSGDNSDESLVVGYQTPDWPAVSPWVTAVGGTTLAVGPSNDYMFETGWGTKRSKWITPVTQTTKCSTQDVWCPTPPGTWIYGSGGGVSRLFAEPSYQQALVPQNSAVFQAQGRVGRAVPDIGAVGDPNSGYEIGITQTFPDGSAHYSEYRIGGTSLSSPIFTGIMALADEQMGSPHGFANPAIYQDAAAFTDVVNPASTVAVVRVDFANSVDASDGLIYSLRTANQTLSLQTTPGYDDVTGIGTPTAAMLNLP